MSLSVRQHLEMELKRLDLLLHREILRHTAFVEGRIDTTFVERTFTTG